MKFIDTITIRYFRSVYTLTLDDCRDLTVITGQNDVGKSNILKALNLFFCQQSDYMTDYYFDMDYSIVRKEDVKRDSIRGQQFISITIKFIRGNRMENSLPPTFSVTRRWDMHSNEYKQTTDVLVRMKQYAKKKGIKFSEKTTNTFLSTFLHKVKFIYIPAIKDDRVFNSVLDLLQQNIFATGNRKVLDKPVRDANDVIQTIVNELQKDFEVATGISSIIGLPSTLNFSNGLLQIDTNVHNSRLNIDKHGDGIKAHYIPKILDYISRKSTNLYIWGFEEPENSYEYRRCIQVAEEFDKQYSKNSQIFITSHSPAFYNNPSDKKQVIRVSCTSGKTQICPAEVSLDEELGYIELYKEFIEKVKQLENENARTAHELEIISAELKEIRTPIILTEGKTDAILLKLALQKLGLSRFKDWIIQPISSDGTANNTVLLRYLYDLQSNASPPQLTIGMFDRDTKIPVNKSGQDIDLRTLDFYRIADKVYAFTIPVPHNRSEANEISIEHYFLDSEIKTEYWGKRLFLGNEFYHTGVYKGDEELFYKGAHSVADTIKIVEHESKKFVTKVDGSGDYSISKMKFVDCIKNNEAGFSNISFSEFSKIFDIIGQIEKDFLSRKI